MIQGIWLYESHGAGSTFSTRKAEMPFGPGPPVLAMTRYTSEAPPPLMKALLPCNVKPVSHHLDAKAKASLVSTWYTSPLHLHCPTMGMRHMASIAWSSAAQPDMWCPTRATESIHTLST